MAISLDYIGKFVIMMVVIAVAISLILTFQGDVEGNVPSVPGDDNGEQREAKVVTIEPTNDAQMRQKIANLVKLCNERGKQSSTSFTCFVLVSEGGPFQFNTGNLPGIDFRGVDTTYNTETLLIRYDITAGEDGYPRFSAP